MSCSYGQKPDLSLIKVFIAVLLLACMTLVSPMIKSRFSNTMKDIIIGGLEAGFKAVRHPEGTQLVVQQKEVGQFAGNDKICDFFIGEIRSYADDPESIRAFYEGQKVKDYGDVRMITLENGSIPEAEKANLPGNLASLSQWDLPPTQTQPLYIVYVLSADYDNSSSLECH